ncbi:hypothetical protein [Rathayibacter tanaceti]|uniref:Uncharacterized protein n=1 Tax=Rathayibacter tanaceti TaxID=1671680 RepID=A0A166HZY0_9MICO|nr:hypothetical protein [Rathayibacter tanaceti]KZX21411.1 hypothetical protein ACH61_01462 [Rathayibacter tanaceti]
MISWSPRGGDSVDSYLRVAEPALRSHLVAELQRLAGPDSSPSHPGAADGGPATTQKGS